MTNILYVLGYIILSPWILLKAIAAIVVMVHNWGSKILGKQLRNNTIDYYKT